MEVACYEATYVGYPEGRGREVAPSMTKGKTNSSQMRNVYVKQRCTAAHMHCTRMTLPRVAPPLHHAVVLGVS